MKVIYRLLCLLLKFIEEILMRIKLIGDTEVHLPHICDDIGYFVGADDITIVQGADFDPTSGVYATDGICGVLPYDVSPSNINTCEVGKHTLTYSTVSFSKTRTITVIQATAPTISGTSQPITVDAGEEFDPMSGVSAVDAHGNTIAVTVALMP